MLLGKLSLADIPFHSWIIMGAFGGMIFGFIFLLALITYLGKWRYLWDEWFTSVDHKKIGIMYIIVALVMGVRGFIDGLMMRTQLVLSYGSAHGYLDPNHFNQIFTGHGVIMIFLMAMPFLIGLINIAVPLQLGTRDVAFPVMNSISLWLVIAAAILMNISLGIGEFAKTGWNAYPPLSELKYSPDVGVDYYIWVLQIAGISSLMTGINFLVTIIKLRAPGMTLMKMPLFCWTTFGTTILIVGAFPILTVALALLTLDRYLGMHFFTNTAGGNMMLYVNWFWAWGHPEVYILILPAFGIYSEVVASFSSKGLFGYTSMVFSIMAITILSYLVWVHHFFIMGNGPIVNAIFGIMTMLIAIPTGVKIFNWLFTIYRGRVRFNTPMLWALGFLITFVIGGMSGVMLAIAPADYVLHNSEFLVAHFHNVIISGTVFGAMAGYIYWFPKAFGFKLNEKLGVAAFGFFLSGFIVTFAPLYMLGFMGMTRRILHYDNPTWQIPMWISEFGILLFLIAFAFFVLQLIVSYLQRKQNRDLTGDPWHGRTMEWSIASPPPHYNYAVIPTITHRDEFWERKQQNTVVPKQTNYHNILMPKNTPLGFIIGMCSLAFGFGMVWHIWWMVILSFIAVIATLIKRTSEDDLYYYIPADEIEEHEKQHTQELEK